MAKYVINRVLQIIPALFILSFILFCMVYRMPTYSFLREYLDQNSVVEMYFDYMGDIFQGNFGETAHSPKTIAEELISRYPPTLIIALGGTVVATIIGIVLGIISAINHNKIIDHIIMVMSLLTTSIPLFFLALILLLIFTLHLRWLPSRGLESWKGYVMPIITLGLPAVGLITRTARSAMLDIIHQDYIKASRARGIPERVVIYYHAFRNTLIPIMTTVGIRFGELLAGTVLVERSFSIPGIGRFMMDAIEYWEINVILACVLTLATTFLIINIIIDILYAMVDARVRYGEITEQH